MKMVRGNAAKSATIAVENREVVVVRDIDGIRGSVPVI